MTSGGREFKSRPAHHFQLPNTTQPTARGNPYMTEEAIHHILVPKHEKINDKEKKELFKRYNITERELPKINITDAAIQHLKPQVGDVIKVTRESPTAGTTTFFRGVTNE